MNEESDIQQTAGVSANREFIAIETYSAGIADPKGLQKLLPVDVVSRQQGKMKNIGIRNVDGYRSQPAFVMAEEFDRPRMDGNAP